MMKFTTEINNIQSEIEKRHNGLCILVKLINYDELVADPANAINTMNELHKIIRNIGSLFNLDVYHYVEHNKVFLVLPAMAEDIINRFVLEIYTQTQLYTSTAFPESCMNCKMASAKFSNDQAKDSNYIEAKADIIYKTLISILAHSQDECYHHQYDSALHDLNLLKNSVMKLNHFRSALRNRNFQFVYQPIIDRKTAYIHYHECLLRFLDENGKWSSVGPIIKEIEKKGLIHLVDYTALEMAVRELSASPKVNLSVNISNVGVLDKNLLTMAEELLNEYKVAKRLIIEITETSLNQDYETTRLFMTKLHKFGCRFALDDFGAGFTSFQQLQKLPIDIIKIDGSYVRNIVHNEHNKYFIETLVKLSEDLGIKTVAEYVENGEIAKFLIDIKVDGMQGNFFFPASTKREN